MKLTYKYSDQLSDIKQHMDSIMIPMPGQCLIQQTYDLQSDLITLKNKYQMKYKELMNRTFKITKHNLSKEFVDNNSILIMQFNMLADGLSTSYSYYFVYLFFYLISLL